jgi:penicillin amidase
MPGLPVVVLGQNEHAAWGFTNTGPDVQDLYLERTRAGEPGRYQTPDGWAEFQVFDETLRVKGRPDVKLRVRATRHGPVISDAGSVPDLVGEKSGAPDLVLAMRWTALDADADPIGVGLAMMRARSVDEFFRAAEGWVAPMQNMVVADRAGRIAWIAPGRVPVRGPDHDLLGLAPAPGWEARYDWSGFVPADRTPRERDPARGWIATANQKVHAADYPFYLGSDWALPYRQQRIEQMLQSRDRHSLDDLARMQADELSLAARPLLPWLGRARADHPQAAAARQALEGFDGTMDAGRVAPLILWAWTRHLTRAVFADDIGVAGFDRMFGGRTFRDALEGVLARDDAAWCDDQSTPAAETCAVMGDRAFAAALTELTARFGPDVGQWRWGRAHEMRAEHRPFSRVPLLAPWFELRTPVGGDTYTVNASRVNLKPNAAGEVYLNEHGPSLRALYDVGNPVNSRVMHSSGQSGLPWMPGYRRFVGPWAKGESVPLWPSGPAAASGGRLVIAPAP